jgi:hypothetical protein
MYFFCFFPQLFSTYKKEKQELHREEPRLDNNSRKQKLRQLKKQIKGTKDQYDADTSWSHCYKYPQLFY